MRPTQPSRYITPESGIKPSGRNRKRSMDGYRVSL
jgi:hypothetical protein